MDEIYDVYVGPVAGTLGEEKEADAVYEALGGIAAGRKKTAEETVEVLRAKLQIMRLWIHDADWDALVRALPEAAGWFDEDGKVK